MSVPANEKRLQLIRECRETAAEVFRLSTENDIGLAQSYDLEILHKYLHAECQKEILSGQEQSAHVSDDSQNTEVIFERQNSINEALEEGSEDGKHAMLIVQNISYENRFTNIILSAFYRFIHPFAKCVRCTPGDQRYARLHEGRVGHCEEEPR